MKIKLNKETLLESQYKFLDDNFEELIDKEFEIDLEQTNDLVVNLEKGDYMLTIRVYDGVKYGFYDKPVLITLRATKTVTGYYEIEFEENDYYHGDFTEE